jgi:hypothetical protein
MARTPVPAIRHARIAGWEPRLGYASHEEASS